MKSSCLKFTRSSAAFSTFDCRLGVREQLNIISSFVDGSQIYGIDAEKSQELRSNVGGKQLTNKLNQLILVIFFLIILGELQSSAGVAKRPYMLKGIDGACRDTTVTVKCFVGGEGRANENLGLTSLQTLFLRAHNKIAQELAALNPRWNDELLFEETRRIVIAILQHVVYGEYLPAIIGWNTATLFDIVPLDRDEYFTGYDETINPSIANEFSSAAFRFGHTMIRNSFSRAGPKHKKMDQVGLDKILFRPVEAYKYVEKVFDFKNKIFSFF
jgi:peroxidase